MLPVEASNNVPEVQVVHKRKQTSYDRLECSRVLHIKPMLVESPREPCAKFAAVMGFAQSGKLMVSQARCGFYLSVVETGSLASGESFSLVPGSRALCITDAIAGKWAKHRRD